jgi:hypothetical protein
VDPAVDEILHLPLVVRVEDEVEVEALGAAPATEPAQIVTTFGS